LTNGDEGARPSFGEVLAESRGAMERFARMRAQAEQVSVTETSADGTVTVTVNSGGVLTDLKIADQALGQPGARVAATVLTTMRQAQAQLANRMNEVMQATMADDGATVDRVLSVYRDRFPEPEPDPKPDTEMRFEPNDEPPGSIMKRS
jgi:DNA-binding protein YbaB